MPFWFQDWTFQASKVWEILEAEQQPATVDIQIQACTIDMLKEHINGPISF